MTTTLATLETLPAVSLAIAEIVCAPFEESPAFQSSSYGATESSSPSGAPSSWNCTAATPQNCVEEFSPTLEVGEHVLEVYEWTNTNALDSDDPPIGRTCFDVTVAR